MKIFELRNSTKNNMNKGVRKRQMILLRRKKRIEGGNFSKNLPLLDYHRPSQL
jgi:hypothetical protein